MVNIGDFGTAVPPPPPDYEPDTFTFYGVEFTVPWQIPWVYIGEFSEAAETEGVEAFSAGMRMIRGVISADGSNQWPQFRELAAVNCSSFEDLMGPCMKIIEAVGERPTLQPSAFADGLKQTEDSSKELSSSEELSNLSPIQRDPRVRELKPVADAGADLIAAL